MRAAILAGLVPCAWASTVYFFTDEGCGTALESYVSQKTPTEVKVTWSTNIVPFAVNECAELSEEITVETAGATTVKATYGLTYGLACSEYGSFSMLLMSSEYKDCMYDWDGTGTSPYQETSATEVKYGILPIGGDASYCYLLNGGQVANSEVDPVYMKTDCNPNRGSVAGIVLGSIALALSLAAVGLAAMAMGKKGGGAKEPAKPAAPAKPAGEEGAQGSTTAAAAVGAATDA